MKEIMQRTDNWQRIWNDDGESGRFITVRTILYAISLLYRLIVNLRNYLYDQQIFREVKLPCPVISVGNITAGGTGKTPCVIRIGQMLQEQGWKPVVLSRGYGGKSSHPVNIVSDGKNILLSGKIAGDEPLLIARSLPGIPVIIGHKRIVTGRAAIDSFGADVLICDDAFQHRQIFRDINLVLLDSRAPLGNGHMLPRGSLREPASSLGRADAFILTRTTEEMAANAIAGRMPFETGNIPLFSSIHRPVDAVKGDYSKTLPLSELQGKKVCAFSGIARPDSFEKAIRDAGAEITSLEIFPDHHRYSQKELESIRGNSAKSGADLILTTEKDGMRLQESAEFLKDIYLLRIKLEFIPDGNSLKNFILGKIALEKKAET
jgi:tetraacyldisaccharide 4'-kinase